jgi:hypothetical protein
MTEKNQISSAGSTARNTVNEKEVEAGSNNNFLAAPSKETRDVSKNSLTIDVDPEKSEQLAETAKELPPRDITGWKWAVVVLSILSSTFLFALDNTIVADIQPVIVMHFNDVKNLTWLSIAFLIGAAATNLIWGKIFGQFNAKWTYILCVLLFELGSAIYVIIYNSLNFELVILGVHSGWPSSLNSFFVKLLRF